MLYHYVGVSGPTEFAQLPYEDQVFWNAWFDRLCEHAAEVARADEDEKVAHPAAFLADL